jgi:2-polyprenyl-6-methoxyphenol hydroxylase-like FAD-dependent oxidoreductase
MHELGLLDEFLTLPHHDVATLSAQIGDAAFRIADFSHLPTVCKYIAFMPQWDFLNFLAAHGRRYDGFRLLMQTPATGLIEHQGRIAGVTALSDAGEYEIRADVVVGTDGRHSTIRERAGFTVDDLGAPMDVLWMRLSRLPGDRSEAFGHADAGRIFIMLDRGDYWQCAFVIPKGSADAMMARDIAEFRAMVLRLSPWLQDRVAELHSWDDVKLFTVTVDRLPVWHREGLICIGDAAHAMSPIGGVGINLAVQDAVAAANILAGPLLAGIVTRRDLARIQARRMWPTQMTQSLQLFIQNRIIRRVLGGTEPLKPPLALKILGWIPALQRIPARLIGIGVRPEHIRTAENANDPRS